MKLIYLLSISYISIICNSCLVFAQEIKNFGTPFIKNYTINDYKASGQNWTIFQDPRGIMYFGNTMGVLEFDGNRWNLIQLPNLSPVRSICADSQGTIYVGGSGELGYLEFNDAGQTIYKSLINLLPEDKRNFEDVWEIKAKENTIFFRTYKYIFKLKEGKVNTISAPDKFRSSLLFETYFFVLDNKKGLGILDNDTILGIQGGEGLGRERGLILPYDDNKLLLASSSMGLFLFDKNGCNPWQTDVSEFIKKNIIFSALRFENGNYALGTWLNGLVIIDKTGKPLQFLNEDNGLINNAIYNIYQDKQKNLWLALDKGIAYVEINSPFTYFNSTNGFKTECYTSIMYKGNLYIGGGPYIMYKKWVDYENPMKRIPFVRIEETSPQLWQLKEIEGTLFGAHTNDLLMINESNITYIPLNGRIVWDIKKAKSNPCLILFGQNDGLFVLHKEQNSWKVRNKVKGFNQLVRWIQMDMKKNLWISSYGKKIYKLNIDGHFDSITSIKHYDIRPNYPLAVSDRICFVEDKIIVSGSDGFYQYDEKTDKFIPFDTFNRHIKKGKPVNITGFDNNGNVWFTDYEGIGIFIKDQDGNYKADRAPFAKFDLPPESYPVFPLNDTNVIIARSDGFIHYDPTYKKDYSIPFKTIIRKFELIDYDSVIYYGNQPAQKNVDKTDKPFINIKYKENSVRISFSATFYESLEKNQFQYKLEGNDENWSNWTRETKKEYTNLPEGRYTFRVKALNVYKVTGTEAFIDFIITPPWFRTIWAYLIYLNAFGSLVFLIVYINSHRLKKANLRLEEIIRKRTEELIVQKQEIEEHRDQLRDLNATKDKLYSIISHDLIGPVGNISSFSELLKKHAYKLNDEKLIKYSEIFWNSAKSTFELLTNLLSWTRLQTRTMKVNPEQFDVLEECDGLITLLESLADNKKIQLIKNYSGELIIFADKNMISTVIRNLISNAIKFTPDEGRIEITAIQTDTTFIYTVSDNGIGISEENIKKIFSVDSNYKKAGTKGEKGTGLGLLLCKDFIALHNGILTVESQQGKGSAFSFTIPLKYNENQIA